MCVCLNHFIYVFSLATQYKLLRYPQYRLISTQISAIILATLYSLYVPHKLQLQQQQEIATRSISMSVKAVFFFHFCVRATRRTSQAAYNLLTHVCVCMIVATFVYAPIAESNMWAACVCMCVWFL